MEGGGGGEGRVRRPAAPSSRDCLVLHPVGSALREEPVCFGLCSSHSGLLFCRFVSWLACLLWSLSADRMSHFAPHLERWCVNVIV